MSFDATVGAIAASNHGVITRDQALTSGMTQRGIRCRIEAGRWLRACNGVYVVWGSPQTFEQRVAIACASASDAIASHCTAGRLHGLRYLPDDTRVHVLVRPGTSIRSTVAVVHTADDRHAHVITRIKNLPVTTIERTIVDVAGSVHRPRLARLVDDALDRKLVTLRSLEDSLRRHERSGRSGTVALRSVVSERGGGLEITESELERRYLGFCESTGVPAPDLQQKIHWRGNVVGRADMAYPRSRVIVELDGRRGHQQLTDQERDRIRDQEAAAAGWLTVRVTWLQLREGRDALRERIVTILDGRISPAESDA